MHLVRLAAQPFGLTVLQLHAPSHLPEPPAFLPAGNKALRQNPIGMGGAIYWAALGDYSGNNAPRLTATFNGPVEFSNNEAHVAGALYVGGGVRVEFKGDTTSFLNNHAVVTPGTASPARGGAILLDSASTTASVTSVEFSSQLTLFQGNQATALSPLGGATVPEQQARGSAIFADAFATQAIVQLHFKGTTQFSNNTATQYRLPVFGGTVALQANDNANANLQMFVSSCVSFQDNVVLQPFGQVNGARVGALGVGRGAASAPITATVAVNTSTGGRLIFGQNRVLAGSLEIPIELDVLINTGGSINCGGGNVKLAGQYRVACDLCAPACTTTTGAGQCNTCASSPSTCPPDCYGQPPVNVTNAVPWACGNTALGATCTSACVNGFVGQAVATCVAGAYSVSGGCNGCSASSQPIGGTTGITGYESCSTNVSGGTYSLTTSCRATCQPNTNGGFASCQLSAGVPTWAITPCTAVCTGNPPSVTGLQWQCPPTTISGGSCTARTCEPGFDGGPVSATCLAGSWFNTTTGPACMRVACVGAPPSLPTATYACTTTSIGAACVAECGAGLSGNIFRVCQANGTFGPQQGDAACVNCTGSPSTLTTVSAGSFPEGSTSVSATFNFQAPFISGTTSLAARLNGGVTPPCTITPPQLTGARATSVNITVSCQAASALPVGQHTISLAATFAGSNGCSGGSLTSLAYPQIAAAPVPAPSVSLTPVDGTSAQACKPPSGVRGSARATFVYEAKPGAAASGGLVLAPPTAVTSAPGATCTVQRTGTPSSGKLKAYCTGVFDGLTSLLITATLNATTQGSLPASATSGASVAFVCCAEAEANAVNPASAGCKTCRTTAGSSTVEGVWHQGELSAGQMLTGDVSPATCTAGSSVGSISAVCDPNQSRLLRVTVTNPPGSTASSLKFLTRCNVPVPEGASCTAQTYAWQKVRGAALNRTVTPSGDVELSFGILMTPSQASCACGVFYWAVKQAGTFGMGGAC